MADFTVSDAVPLRADPDVNSPSIAAASVGDKITLQLKLGDWAKVTVKDKNNNVINGWLPAAQLKEIPGATVRVHPEPLSKEFKLVTGTIEILGALANWRKVRVSSNGNQTTGWIEMETLGAEHAAGAGEVVPADDDAPELSLGVNEVYRQAILKAEQITDIDAAALAALIDAEADKITSGPNKGQWNRNSRNPDSGAGGLTQFLGSTWLAHAKNSTHLLNQVAKQKGFISAQNMVLSEKELLDLRFDPTLSIVSAAEYGLSNLRALDQQNLLPQGLGDDDKARYIYLAHHEGPAGAVAFLRKENSNSFEKFATQVGQARAADLVQAAGGNVALAYRSWLDGYMDQKIQPSRFRKAGSIGTGGPTPVNISSKALSNFDGPALPMSMIGGQRELVLEVQQALSRLGYLDPPADGRFGPVSLWALNEFCRINDLTTTDGFTKEIARALVNPNKQLPEIKKTGRWFDKVIAYMNDKGYWICRHPRCTNIVYLEGANENGMVNDDRPNLFNDLRVLFSIDASGMPVTRMWDATTEPGTYWTMNPMNSGGAARIAFDQYKSWIVGTHMRGKPSAHEALVQVAPVAVHRDLNKDFKRTNDRIDTGLFGINQHWGYDAPKDDLGTTSAGCLVGRTKSGHRDFMALVKADSRFGANPGYRFMAAVLPGDAALG